MARVARKDTEEMDGKVFNEEEKTEFGFFNLFSFWEEGGLLFFFWWWWGFFWGVRGVWDFYLFVCLDFFVSFCFLALYDCERNSVLWRRGETTAEIFSWQIHGLEKKYAFKEVINIFY